MSRVVVTTVVLMVVWEVVVKEVDMLITVRITTVYLELMA